MLSTNFKIDEPRCNSAQRQFQRGPTRITTDLTTLKCRSKAERICRSIATIATRPGPQQQSASRQLLSQARMRHVRRIVHCCTNYYSIASIHTHTRLTALFPGLPRWAGTRKVKPIWILLEQETVSGSGISWAMHKSAPRSRQITMPAPHHSVFYRPDALPAAQPTVSKH